ncbi:hypothetical protein [Nonomuraea sp. NPDC050691]|uniref:hypothetical protein n=1 Tax=Nonomuraea sp. NPDC050691 TaxID=3155661 RepID=UPI0033F8FF3D
MNRNKFFTAMAGATLVAGLTAAAPSGAAAVTRGGVDASAAVATESGCSRWTCIEAFRTVANVVYARATKRPEAPSNCESAPYHFRIWGPGKSVNSELIHYCYQWTRYVTFSPGKICAEGWAHVPGGVQSRGLPCVTL